MTPCAFRTRDKRNGSEHDIEICLSLVSWGQWKCDLKQLEDGFVFKRCHVLESSNFFQLELY